MFHVKQFFRKRKRGLAIGGGGVRSASAVGVLKYFQKHSIKFDFVSGTSMGAIVGALYCYHLSAEVVEKKIKETYESSFFSDLREEFKSNLQSKSDINEASIKERFTTYFSRLKLFRKMITETSIVSHDRVKSFIEEIIPDLNIEDLPVKFCCVATDITRGKRHVFRKGPLREAIMASIAVPGIIAPSQIENLILSDGGSVSVTPVEELKAAGAGFIVAIEVFPHMKERSGFDRGIEIMERCSKITAMELHRKQIAEADVIISPEVKDLVWSDFDAFNYAVEAGEKAAVGADKLIR